jgi:hypothetical protein
MHLDGGDDFVGLAPSSLQSGLRLKWADRSFFNSTTTILGTSTKQLDVRRESVYHRLRAPLDYTRVPVATFSTQTMRLLISCTRYLAWMGRKQTYPLGCFQHNPLSNW